MAPAMAKDTAIAPVAALSTLPDAQNGAEALELINYNHSNKPDGESQSPNGTASEKRADVETKASDEVDHEKGSDTLGRNEKSREEMNHVTGFRLVVIVVCLMLAIFCVALDNTSQS